MKKYLYNLVIYLIPLALVFIPIEYYLRDNSYQAKRTYLDAHEDDIQALILGPSYSWRAIDPIQMDVPVASLAHEASAINTNLMLFEKFAPNLHQLKYVFFDLSLGYMEHENTEKWESNHLFNIYYDIQNYPMELKNNFLLSANFHYYFKLFCAYQQDRNNIEEFNESGFIYKLSAITDVFGQYDYDTAKMREADVLYKRIAFQNTVNDSIYSKNERLLDDFVQYCKKRNISVIFLSPPKFCLNNQAATEEIIARRQRFLSKYEGDDEVEFWNYEHLLENNAHYFLDDTHLNPKGAELFTEMVNKRLISYAKNHQSPSYRTH